MEKTNSFGNEPAVLYARVSSEEQEKEGYSIPAQLKLLREYADRKQLRIIKEFIDTETAKQPGRPSFKEMVTFLKTESKKKSDQKCHTILVEKTDRFYRNLKDYITIDELGVDIHFAKEGVVLSPNSHSSEKLMHGIKVLLAKNYIDNLSEEVRKGMKEKAEQGQPPSRAPLGYCNVELDNGKRGVAQDKEIAPVIKRMFEQYATGRYSIADLAEMGKQEGLFAGRENDRVVATLHTNLKNPFYYGEFRYKGKLYQGTYDPLISKELWEKVQEILQDRGTRKPRQVKHNFAFQNLIRCGHCGCALVGEIQKKKYIYYHCTYYKGKCDEPYVREEVLEEKFLEVLQRLHFDKEVLDLVKIAIIENHQTEKITHQEAIDRLRSQYDRMQRRIDTAYEDRLDGRISVSDYDQKVAKWRFEQDQMLQSMQDHQQANEAYLEGGVTLLELASHAADLFAQQPAKEKRRLLDFVLSNSTWKNGELTVEYRQPFDMIALEANECAQEKAAGLLSSDLHQKRLPN